MPWSSSRALLAPSSVPISTKPVVRSKASTSPTGLATLTSTTSPQVSKSFLRSSSVVSPGSDRATSDLPPCSWSAGFPPPPALPHSKSSSPLRYRKALSRSSWWATLVLSLERPQRFTLHNLAMASTSSSSSSSARSDANPNPFDASSSHLSYISLACALAESRASWSLFLFFATLHLLHRAWFLPEAGSPHASQKFSPAATSDDEAVTAADDR
mmetsp:Transcript_7944/g.28792  ORF Transcript_7944/g.28792 Transcript_7944/m.28792 type:complete len:214 (-) Transcript_7944:74-715(-)